MLPEAIPIWGLHGALDEGVAGHPAAGRREAGSFCSGSSTDSQSVALKEVEMSV